MGTFLFDKIVFGPVYSRRLGHSLGLNLLPTGEKICTFDCVYCECGWTKSNTAKFVDVDVFKEALENKLQKMLENNEIADTITYAGNGEPTLHPYFDEIIDVSINLRDKYMPNTDIAVLSNSTTLSNDKVFNSLFKIEKRIMKLDVGSNEMFDKINQCNSNIMLEDIVNNLARFNGDLIIQTLLLKGKIGNIYFDSSTEKELTLLREHLAKINPHTLMLYSIYRGTPMETLEAISNEELEKVKNYLALYLPNCKILVY